MPTLSPKKHKQRDKEAAVTAGAPKQNAIVKNNKWTCFALAHTSDYVEPKENDRLDGGCKGEGGEFHAEASQGLKSSDLMQQRCCQQQKSSTCIAIAFLSPRSNTMHMIIARASIQPSCKVFESKQ